MTHARHYALFVLAGAGAHWVPDILVHWARPPHYTSIALLTFLVPLVVAAAWLLLARQPALARFRVALPLGMLLGIWLVGPVALALGSLPFGGKFFSASLADFLLLWALFPFSTFIMATYSGSLGGVGLSTLLLLIAALVGGLHGRAAALAARKS